ncbi:MAG TPA: hypothetical protein VGM91_11355 [Conexibacter sp.]|jgi:phage shock protein PspC (stress-responsive transcriptional regulator)
MSDELARGGGRPRRRGEGPAALPDEAGAALDGEGHAALPGDAPAALGRPIDAPLPARPPLTTPRRLRGRALLGRERELVRRQPWLGFAGLVVVVPLTVLLVVVAGGAESSLEVLAPLSTFALPVVAMVAFWWEDWPGSSLTPGWSGIVNTAVVIVCTIGLTIAGQAVVGRADLHSLFDGTPGPGHPATFPATLPLAAIAFTVILQLTLVSEGWPLRGRLPRLWAGLAAVVVSWGIALLVYYLLAEIDPRAPDLATGLKSQDGLVSGQSIGAWLISVALWQSVVFIALRGWPVLSISVRGWRIAAGNALTIAGGWASYLVLREVFSVSLGSIAAALGCGVAATLLAAMLMEGWLGDKLHEARWRVVAVCGVTTVTVVLYVVLKLIADGIDFHKAQASDWILYAGLDAIGTAVILHVAIWRRWPVSGVR